ncbi:MAG: ABC transporter permease [Alphaproteobacteria bacterium]
MTRRRLPRWLRSGRVLVGGSIVVIAIICAVCAPLLAPHDPQVQELLYTNLPPAWVVGGDPQFFLGTDSIGRDVLSRLIYGTRVALYVAFLGGFSTMILGGTLALVAGYLGGWLDWIVSRAVELWMAFPPIVLSLILMVGLGVGVNNVVLAIVLVDWTRFARVLRADVLVVTKRDYIAAARLAGFTHFQIFRRELLPAVRPLLITMLSLEMAIAVIVEAILSFVGQSVEATVPAWGIMIADARLHMYENVWALLFPFFAIFLLVLAFNLLGDGLRRTLDPKLQRNQRIEA